MTRKIAPSELELLILKVRWESQAAGETPCVVRGRLGTMDREPAHTSAIPKLNVMITRKIARGSKLVERVVRILGQPTSERKSNRLVGVPISLALSLLISGVFLLAIGLNSIGNRSGTALIGDGEVATKQEPATQDKYAIEDCVERDGDDDVVVLRGEVFMPDGSAATNLVRLTKNRLFENSLTTVTFEGNRFSVRTKGIGIYVRIGTSDGLWAADLRVDSQDLRQTVLKEMRLTLNAVDTKPVRIPVLVRHNGKPKSGATVEFDKQRAVTDASGQATLEVASLTYYGGVLAWTNDGLVGASEKLGEMNRETMSTTYDGRTMNVDLVATRPLKIKIIDEEKKPVSNLSLKVSFSTDNNSNSFSANTIEEINTDAEGNVVTNWCPDWPLARVNVLNDYQQKVGTKIKSGISYFQTIANIASLDEMTIPVKHEKPRRIITGTVSVEGTSPAGFNIEARGRVEGSSMSDMVHTLTGANGEFRFAALEGVPYTIHVINQKYVCPSWNGVLCRANDEKMEHPRLETVIGEPVEIVCTKGSKGEPLVGGTLQITSANKANSFMGRSCIATTNEQGVAQFWTAPGRISVYLSTQNGYADKEYSITKNGKNHFKLHVDVPDNNRFSGRIRFNEEMRKQKISFSARILGTASADQTDRVVEINETGEFDFESPSNQLAMFVQSSDGKWTGLKKIIAGKNDLDIELVPSISYRAKLVDEAGAPVANSNIRFDGYLPEKFGRLEGSSYQKLVCVPSRTDADGKFTIENLPTEIKFRVYRTGDQNSANNMHILGQSLGEKYFRAGEDRPDETIVVPAAQPDAPALKPKERPSVPLSQATSERLRDCRLSKTNCLVFICGAPEREQAYDLLEQLDERDDETDAPPSISFLPLMIDAHSRRGNAEKTKELEDQGWKIPAERDVLVVALDETGKELGRIEGPFKDGKTVEGLKSLVAAHKPSPENAAEKLKTALAEARKTNRKVWVDLSQTRCGPCFLLSRWLDDQRLLLEKDFVIVKIDNVRDTEGIAVAQQLLGDRPLSVPVFFFLDAEGKELDSSFGDNGNIGYAGGSQEGAQQLLGTLRKLRQHLSDAELETLRESLYPTPKR